MTFKLIPHINPEVAKVAYKLPALPAGTSHRLRQMVASYSDAIRTGKPGAEDEPYSWIANFDPQGLPDIIAKLLMQLHYDNTGLDGDELVLCVKEDAEVQTRVAMTELLLRDLYAQLPQDWPSALRAYRAALVAESDYDKRVWHPEFERQQAGGGRTSEHVEVEMERLMELRCKAEDVLFDMPAPSLEAFAIKYLIAFDDNRDLNGWHEALCADAKRFLGINDLADAAETEAMLRNLNWRSAA